MRPRTRCRAACRRHWRSAARPYEGERLRQQSVSIRRVIPERAAAEVSPQVEVLQFHARGFFVIPGEKREVHIGTSGEFVEEPADTWHDALAWSRPVELCRQMSEVGVA